MLFLFGDVFLLDSILSLLAVQRNETVKEKQLNQMDPIVVYSNRLYLPCTLTVEYQPAQDQTGVSLIAS